MVAGINAGARRGRDAFVALDLVGVLETFYLLEFCPHKPPLFVEERLAFLGPSGDVGGGGFVHVGHWRHDRLRYPRF